MTPEEARALRLMGVGGALLLAGAVIPMLMIVSVLEPGFALSFASYAATVIGLSVGLIGVARYHQGG